MRIKSYFAPSVQSAIALARREFGDDVTLVTSHVASADARHLGEYEVVFAVEGEFKPVAADADRATPPAIEPSKPTASPLPIPTPTEPTPEPRFSAFQEALLQAVAPKTGAADSAGQKLDGVRSSLIELGIEAATTRAVMALLEQCLGVRAPAEQSVGTLLSDMADSVLNECQPSTPQEMQKAAVAPAAAKERTRASSALMESARPVDLFPAAKGGRPRRSSAELAFISSISEIPQNELAWSK